MLIVRRIDELEEVGYYSDIRTENRMKAAAMIGIPLVTTLTASYFINKAAYPKDFSILKWLGIPLVIAIVSGGTFLLTSLAVGPFEEPVET